MAKTKTWEDYIVLNSAKDCNKVITCIDKELNALGGNAVYNFLMGIATLITGPVIAPALGTQATLMGLAVNTQKNVLNKYKSKIVKIRDAFDDKKITSAVVHNVMVGTWDITAKTYIIRFNDPIVNTNPPVSI